MLTPPAAATTGLEGKCANLATKAAIIRGENFFHLDHMKSSFRRRERLSQVP